MRIYVDITDRIMVNPPPSAIAFGGWKEITEEEYKALLEKQNSTDSEAKNTK